MTHCRHLPSGEPHINIAFFSTDASLTANLLIITFVSLIESEELTSEQPLHIVPFGYEPRHTTTEHYAWNYALNAHWSSFIKMFCFSWMWATFFPSLCSSTITTRTSYAAPAPCEQVEEERKKNKIFQRRNETCFFFILFKALVPETLTPADAKRSHISFSCISLSLSPVLWTVQMFVLLELLGLDLNLTSCLSKL